MKSLKSYMAVKLAMLLAIFACIPFYQRTTAAEVSAAFGFLPHQRARADTAQAMEALQNRLIQLKDEANNIQARADAEKRPLSADEQKDMAEIFAAFEEANQEIATREQIENINAQVSAPAGRRTAAAVADEEDDQAEPVINPQARSRVAVVSPAQTRQYAQARTTDAGKHGFRSAGEFMFAVMKASQKGGQVDQRLIVNAAPGSFGSEGVGQDGGFAVPPEFRTAIMQKIMGEDSLLSLTDQQTLSTNSITFPADETSPWQSTGGIQAYWENEGGLKTQSKLQLTEKTLKLSKVIALVPMTDELLEDAPAMASYVNRKAPEKISFKVNDAIINGSGVGQPLGILNSAGTIIVAKESGQAADSVVFQNIVKLWTSITPSARRNAKWLMNADVEQQLMSMQFPNVGSGAAVPVYLPPGGLSQSPYGTLLGREIIYTEAAQALGDQGDIIFGDLSNYLSGVKSGGVKSDVSIHLWFDYDLTAFRFVLRVGGQPWWNQPIAPFNAGSATRGFFATLAART